MSNNIELLSNTENFTIGTNSNLSEILANVVRVGTDTSNVTISIPQDISSSYNLILPVRQGASGESLVYGADGQLKWDDPTVLKQVVSVFGPNLTSNVVSKGTHDLPTYLDAYIANITPMSDNSKIFVQFKVNYHAALSASNQISFFIKKTYDGNETIFTESLFGPYNAVGGFTGQYISNLIDEALTSNSISYQLGYQISGTVNISDILGILGYDASYNNTIVLQEFEGSGVYTTSVWNKGADSNGLYYNEGTVHIGSTKNALGSQNTPGVALELSGNLVGTNATFSGNITAHAITVDEAFIGPNTLYINGMRVLNQNEDTGSVNIYTDEIISESTNGLTIQANGDNGNIILDPSGTGTIQLNGDVELSGGNISAETFIGDLSGNVNAVTMTATTTTTNNLSLDGTLTTSNSTRVEGNLIPSVDDTYSLGAPDKLWKDLYTTRISFQSGNYIDNTEGVKFIYVHETSIFNGDSSFNSNVDIKGNLTVRGSLNYNSDKRLKENNIDIINGIELIKKLKPQIYDKRNKLELDDNNYYIKESGFIAQDIEEVEELKHLINKPKNIEKEPYTMNYIGLIAYNTAATKELDNIVEQQKIKINSQENRIQHLEDKVLLQETLINQLISRIEALENS